MAPRFVVHGHKLGKGAYGQVLLGTDTEGSAQGRCPEVAVKMIPAGRMRPEALQREISILQRLTEDGHPSILALRASLPPGSQAIRSEGIDEGDGSSRSSAPPIGDSTAS